MTISMATAAYFVFRVIATVCIVSSFTGLLGCLLVRITGSEYWIHFRDIAFLITLTGLAAIVIFAVFCFAVWLLYLLWTV